MKPTLRRLPQARVDLREPVEFSFDGRRYAGYAGDSLASALLANGVDVVGRSFKLHRPRGVFAAGEEEGGALVRLEGVGHGEPNARATQVALYPGLDARSQNAWPGARRDVGALVGPLRRFLPASFYYKTFQWPSWRFWEPFVRRAAGLGRVPGEPDPQRYLRQNRHVEVLVVGAGRAGLQAALDASDDGSARVLLLDQQEAPGGRLLASAAPADRDWLAAALERLAQRDNVTVLPRTTVTGYYDHNMLAAVERLADHLGPAAPPELPRQRLWRIFAGRVVLATGALERPLVFPDNDRPGIMLLSALCEYAHRYGVVPGEAIAVYTNNDSGWRRALALADAGVPVTHVVDLRRSVDEALRARLRRAGIAGHVGYRVVATRGRPAIDGITLAARDDGASPGAALRHLGCDVLALAGGWTPTLQLYSQAGGALSWRDADSCFVPGDCRHAVSVVGRAGGDFGETLALEPQWFTPGVATDRQWVDPLYDVSVADIQLAVRENYVSVEHLKRYTTAGMAPDQGKTGNVNALGILAELTGRAVPEVGTTRFRPPYHPVSLGAFAGIERGALYQPFRRLPAHESHLALGAAFEDYGGWQRPVCYPRHREREAEAVTREVHAVRTAAGLLDYSPLGKIEVCGPDAREFLDRVYVNDLGGLAPGRARYGLLLREDGIVMDDGVVVCRTPERFLLHTTAGGAAAVREHLEEWLQCEWPDLAVAVDDATSAWATFMLAGPAARAVLAAVALAPELPAATLGHMRYAEGRFAGVPCRLLRASFTGELSFEISVPAARGRALWDALLAAGRPHGLLPIGIEALLVLRMEKGFVHVGVDTDGTTMPQDLGWGPAIARKTGDFIGRRSLSLPVGRDGGRRQFTGIEPLDPSARLRDGAHVLSGDGSASAGYVTSACYSPTLGRTVALGLVARARERLGETVKVCYGGETIAARLVAPGAYDPAGERLRD